MTEGRKRVLIVLGALIWVGPLNPFLLLPILRGNTAGSFVWGMLYGLLVAEYWP